MNPIKKDLVTSYAASGGDQSWEAGSLLDYTIIGVQIVWSGLDAADGVVQFEQSHDETNYDVNGLTKTLDTASGSHTLGDTAFSGNFARVAFTANAVTAGSISVKLIAK